jgi:Trm5-related predicted tRNA methylase
MSSTGSFPSVSSFANHDTCKRKQFLITNAQKILVTSTPKNPHLLGKEL